MNKKELQALLDEKFLDKKSIYGENKHLYKNMRFAVRYYYLGTIICIWKGENEMANSIFWLDKKMFSKVEIRIL